MQTRWDLPKSPFLFSRKKKEIYSSPVRSIVHAEHDEIFSLYSQAFAACCRTTGTEQRPSHTLQNSCTESDAGDTSGSRVPSASDVHSVSWHVPRTACRMSGTSRKVPATLRRTGRSGLTAHLRINTLRQGEGGGRVRVSDSPYVKSLALRLDDSLGFTVQLLGRDTVKEIHRSASGHKVSIASRITRSHNL